MMNDVTIGKGKLEGKGVYANRDFKRDEIVIMYKLKKLSEEEYKHLPKSEKSFTHNHRGIIYLYASPERYVNHSKNPNTYPDHLDQCDRALREIKKGEAITCDHHKDDIS